MLIGSLNMYCEEKCLPIMYCDPQVGLPENDKDKIRGLRGQTVKNGGGREKGRVIYGGRLLPPTKMLPAHKQFLSIFNH